jgi:hypothetical protein
MPKGERHGRLPGQARPALVLRRFLHYDAESTVTLKTRIEFGGIDGGWPAVP